MTDGKFDTQKRQDDSTAMSEQAFNRPAEVDAEAEIELLACETHVPREVVQVVYNSERAKLERTARIKTYIPVLVHRHVKALLRERRRA
jgi:hypothetical protein